MPPVTVNVLAGPAAGATCTKDAKQKVCLGRNKTGNLIALKDDQVSGKHLELSWADGCWFALDLNSTNGTRQNDSNSKFLEGQKYKLRSGDTLHLGPDTVVQVHFDVSKRPMGLSRCLNSTCQTEHGRQQPQASRAMILILQWDSNSIIKILQHQSRASVVLIQYLHQHLHPP
eukprot:GHUV01014067.1.p1 GENE.GHUV01014067.1~~GHUV01014067.1.p1  ORF type:complete len:173 (+),score=22.46 GHUV01014067.1:789-1307(+)